MLLFPVQSADLLSEAAEFKVLRWSQSKYLSKINLIVVYISEAHAADEWALSNKIQINQHKTVQERIEAAKFICSYKDVNYSQSMFVDSIDYPNYESVYSGWPERGYVIDKNKIVHICYGRIEDLIRWGEEIEEWMQQNVFNKTD